MKALNFYSLNYEAHLVRQQKHCTIRVGDKSDRYRRGDVVWVTTGHKFKPRKKIYAAVIDEVMIKPMAELSAGDIRSENPDWSSVEDLKAYLEDIYGREVADSETVSVIYFSPIQEG